MVERRRTEADEHLAGPGDRIFHVLVPEDLGTPVLVDADCLHGPRS
jgi:hypothetical protein